MKAPAMEEKHIIALIPSLSYQHALCLQWAFLGVQLCQNLFKRSSARKKNETKPKPK